MEQKSGKKWSVGSIIFLCLYGLALLKGIGIIVARGKFLEIFSEFKIEMPLITLFFLKYGHFFSIIVIGGTLVLIIRECITKKFVPLKVSLISFLIVLSWDIIFIISYFLPLVSKLVIEKA